MNIYFQDNVFWEDVPVTVAAEHEEELMKSDFVRLSWADAARRVIKAGSYVIPYPSELSPVKYILFRDYIPEQTTIGEYTYKPEFQHPKMWLGYVPFLFHTMDAAGDPVDKTEYDYIGALGTLLQTLCDTINTALTNAGFIQQGEDIFSLQPVGDTIDMMETVSVSFSNDDILSAMSRVCEATGFEYHLEWLSSQKIFYFGSIYLGGAVGEDDDYELEIGRNIDVPKVTESKDKQYNRFYVQGGTRNNARSTEHGNIALNTRLTLVGYTHPADPVHGTPAYTYTESIIDTRPTAEQNSPGLTGIITKDEVYPHLDLYLYDIHERKKFKTDENGNVTTEPWSVWYFKLCYYDNGWKDFLLKSDPNTSVTTEATSPDDPVVGTDLPIEDIGLPVETKTIDGVQVEQRVATVRQRGGSTNIKVGVRSGRYDHLEFEQYINDEEVGQDSKEFLNGLHRSDRIDILTPIDLDTLPYDNFVHGTDASGNLIVTTHAIDGLKPMIGFMYNDDATNTLANALGTREFEVKYNSTAITFDAKDDQPNQTGIGAGYYEIIHTTEGSDQMIIPSTSEQGIIPYEDINDRRKSSKAQIFNVVLDDPQGTFKKLAQRELETEAKVEIARIMADQNHYTANADPIVFEEHKPGDIKIGRRVVFDDAAGYRINSRIIKLVTKLDYDFETEITFGNKLTKRFSDRVMAQLARLGSGTGGYDTIDLTPEAQKVTYVEYPEWVQGGSYFFESINKKTGVLETSYVYHRGKKWMCMRTLTTEEPQLGAQDWVVVGGDQTFQIKFYDAATGGYAYGESVLVRVGYVNVPVYPIVLWGTDDVSAKVNAWLWERETKIGGKVNWSTDRNITITDASLPPAWSPTNPAIFTCTATINGIDIPITNIVTI